MFRKFGRHSARILWHSQCQLIALEKEIDHLDEQLRTTKDLDTRRALQRRETLMARAEDPNSIEHHLVAKLREFERCLKEYCKHKHQIIKAVGLYTNRH